MRLTFIFFLMTFFTITSALANPLKGLTLAAGCRLYDVYGRNIKNFPGSMCLYMDDGNFISGNENALRMFNKANEVLWEIKGHFHHQINLTQDKQKILALSSHVTGETGKVTRQDKLMIIALDGKVLHERLMIDIMNEAKSPVIDWMLDPHMRTFFGSGKEVSHLNSIYEISENKGSKNFNYLKKGNIVISGLETGIHFLTPDLSNVIHFIYLKDAILHSVHDVQINSEGNLLFFNNAVKTNVPKTTSHPNWRAFNGHHSAIMEMNPKTQKLISKFEANPKEIFYSKACGSVQELDKDTWLFTHMVNGTYIYSKGQKKMLHSLPATHLSDHTFIPIQQVKAWDLSKFLSHWN